MNSLTEQALTLHRQGRLAEAEALYLQALAVDARDVTARQFLGVARAQSGRNAEALADLDAALSLKPGDADIALNRANVLKALGRYQEALAGFDAAIAARPGFAQAHNNRGSLLQDLKRPAEAVAAYDAALKIEPRFSAALNNRGSAMMDLGRHVDALNCFDRALALAPRDAQLHNNRGNALLCLLRHDEAVAAYDRALAINPDYPQAFSNRGAALQELKRHDEALDSFEKAGSDPAAFGGAAMAALNLNDWTRTAKFAAQMPGRIAAGETVPPWLVLGYSDDPHLQLQAARNVIRQRFPALPPPLATARYRHDSLRLGYISSDYLHHPVAAQLAQLIELHDRNRFEVIGLSTGRDDGSPHRARLVAGFDRFVDLAGMETLEAAQTIRALEIDVLVDLNGHTQGDSFDILSHRPAPVQATWLGYAGTTAAPFIDHIIADRVVAADPSAFSEQPALMPHCFFPTDTTLPVGTAPTRAVAGLPKDGFVFASFNANWKITADVFALWMRLLRQVEGSVLWLKKPGTAAAANLKRAAQAAGIDPARLVFAPPAALDVHFARHALADLFLDTLPYNAHATCCDALWSGLPVLTCAGRAYAGRVAASMLRAVGLPELVTQSPEEYEALALALARDPAQLKDLRARLANRATTPLFDMAQFARDIEALYLTLVQ
jgi:predicted O-linked N-acetylglucosamine transferase (SPINDLY family)